MTTPYRDQVLTCPACNQPLRPYKTRFLCDGCQGMFVTLVDLSEALVELTGQEPVIELVDDKVGDRGCPHCTGKLTRCHIRLVFGEEVAKPHPELDRCAEHGIWFDRDELAKVFQKAYAKVGHQGGGGRGVSSAGHKVVGDYMGANGVPDWWNV